MKEKYLAIALSMFLGACSSLMVNSDYDKTINFSNYKTYSFYGWGEESNKLLSAFDQERIEKSFANEFNNRHLKFVPKGGDLVIALYIVVDTTTSTVAYTNYYRHDPYYYNTPWAWSMGHSTTTYHDYDYLVGTLVCDVFDSKTKQLIWQGVGTGDINENPKKRSKTIPRTVSAIMQKYPISAQKK